MSSHQTREMARAFDTTIGETGSGDANADSKHRATRTLAVIERGTESRREMSDTQPEAWRCTTCLDTEPGHDMPMRDCTGETDDNGDCGTWEPVYHPVASSSEPEANEWPENACLACHDPNPESSTGICVWCEPGCEWERERIIGIIEDEQAFYDGGGEAWFVLEDALKRIRGGQHE